MRKQIHKKLRLAQELLDRGDVSLKALAAEVGMSESGLHRQFCETFGLSPSKYRQQKRLENFKRGLKAGQSVTQATYAAGYGSSSRIYEQSDAVLGMSPGVYAKGGLGQLIHFVQLRTDLGRCLIAATERGVCAVLLEDGKTDLLAQLKAEFPKAQLREQTAGADSFLKPRLDAVVRRLSGLAAELPLDFVGTAFQRCVWEALMKIPRGQTRSYAEVAQAIGKPGAHRAVARACAQNKLAVVVPCHRVIRSDGTLADYRWGIDKKQFLLARESTHDTRN